MKNIFRFMFTALLIVAAVIPGKAEVYRYENVTKGQRAQTAAGCAPSTSFEWLDINNVKTRINAGGDMWWDLPAGTGSKYYIPANGSATSLFAGSLWIAGVDVNQQLKCAALRFRQVGNDYWTGPLTVDGKASITDETCARWDKMFKIMPSGFDQVIVIVGRQLNRYFMDRLKSNSPKAGISSPVSSSRLLPPAVRSCPSAGISPRQIPSCRQPPSQSDQSLRFCTGNSLQER